MRVTTKRDIFFVKGFNILNSGKAFEEADD